MNLLKRSKCCASLNLTKINFDGGIFDEVNKSGIRVVICNHYGLLIMSVSLWFPQAYKPVEIEALVATQVLQFGLEIGIDRVIVEGDSVVVMKALANESRNMTSYGVLIQDAKVFSGFYSKLLYSNTKRECNKIVHSLVRLVVNIVLCG